MLPATQKHSEKLVRIATEFGISVVQEIAAEALKHKPGMSLINFVKVLDKYVENMDQNITTQTSIVTPPPSNKPS